MTLKSPLISGVFLVFVAAAGSVSAQKVTSTRRIADLNAGSVGSVPTNLRVYGQRLCFSAYTLSTGKELWSYDGTNIALVADINATPGNDSSPTWLTPFAGSLYFSAYDARRGGELWRYDGTNTIRVADINPDPDDTIKANPANSWPTELAELNGTLYFNANGGGAKPNYELWKCDGVSVTLAANIHADSGSDYSSYPKGLTAFNGALYFMADDGVNGYELWKATAAGAVLFANLNAGGSSSHSYPKYFTPFNGALYFQAFDSARGYELRKTDGIAAPVGIDLNPGTAGSFAEFLTVFENALYFRANIGTTGYELWKYDGATATLAANVNPTGDAFPKNLTVFKDHLIFAADDGVHGWEMWKFDGTTASLVADLNPTGDSFPESLVSVNDVVYFIATTPATGYEMWKYDGTAVTLAADVNPGANSSNPRNPTAFNGELCFSAADNGVEDWELWRILSVPFRVTVIERTGGDVHLTWSTVGGSTNVVKYSDGGVGGPYFDLSGPMLIPGVSATTADYWDRGGASGRNSRFYRIVQP